ncbi:hypothetical protein Pcinc_024890 [Petrolisthes cinctipes]|uniref:Uncharacterized protein n=1 Tax=Petrolisthes cinctipes TaxID=88211 RepID=A0AAE1KCX0_PETCI|nr:hypothetical protein Pcinc_024890 [Petrolisthes cinctipes]
MTKRSPSSAVDQSGEQGSKDEEHEVDHTHLYSAVDQSKNDKTLPSSAVDQSRNDNTVFLQRSISPESKAAKMKNTKLKTPISLQRSINPENKTAKMKNTRLNTRNKTTAKTTAN